MTHDDDDGGGGGGGGGAWARVTAAGCYAAAARAADDGGSRALLELLSLETTPAWDESAHGALGTAGLVERVADPEAVPAEPLERFLPGVLPALSDRGQVVLSESRQGLFLDSAGLSRDDAERLAVTGSGLAALLARDALLPDARLGVGSAAIGLIDPDGHAEVGFWPLHVGRYVFMLTVFGIPRFNGDGFRRLVWTLQQRYGAEAGVPGAGADAPTSPGADAAPDAPVRRP